MELRGQSSCETNINSGASRVLARMLLDCDRSRYVVGCGTRVGYRVRLARYGAVRAREGALVLVAYTSVSLLGNIDFYRSMLMLF
jgi:hypothetical protein